MSLRLVPGADRDNTIKGLQEAANRLMTTRSLRDEARYLGYGNWANDTVGLLRHMIRPVDLEAMVLTRRYWAIQSLAHDQGTPVVNQLLNMEIEERIRALEETVTELKDEVRRWSRAGVFVMPDTSAYINYPKKLENWDLRTDLQMTESIHLLVPIIVVDELDKLKEHKDKHVRWRAGHSLGVLDERLQGKAESGVLDPGDALGRGVTLEIVLDPPGHVRLPIEDDEIIDRGLAIQSIAARPVTLLTYDTGQSTRARLLGLGYHKLTKPPEPEPPAPAPTR